MSTDMSESEAFQKTADTLRRCSAEMLAPNDPSRQLLDLAANQLENAADTAMALERFITSPNGKSDMIKDRPSSHSGQWESERQVDISKARAEGFAFGLALAGVISFGAVALARVFA
jgi:hypothetical protein